MSLSSWLRDYLYFPLGGSRVPKPRVYMNLMITMALGGLWHGASWHFMVWGIYQGVLLCLHRFWEQTIGATSTYKRLIRFPVMDFITRPLTFGFVCIGWVFFRASHLRTALAMLLSLFAFWRPLLAGWSLSLQSMPVILMAGASCVVGAGWVIAPGRVPLQRVTAYLIGKINPIWVWVARALVYRPALYALAVCVLLLWPPHSVQRFIYFQF
jgi:D-alanyl-lipoteichoic acid acyltransferase DltB (MBOAT superfamily)